MEPPPSVRAGSALSYGGFDPLSLRDLWGLVNRPQPIDPAAIRAACVVLLVSYAISSAIRHVPYPVDWAIRVGLVGYTIIGIVFAPRFSWTTQRAYTVGMALLLPVTTAGLEVMRGNQPADVALTALAIFAPLVFLQTAVDVLAVSALLAGGIVVLAITGAPGVPAAVTLIVLGGALTAGAVTAVVLIAFRGRVSESTAWWQAACARERALREFIELAAPHLGDHVLTREFAARLRSAFGAGHCAVVLLEPGSRTPRVAATAGTAAGESSKPAVADPVALADLLTALGNRQPIVCERLTAEDVERRFAGLPWLAVGGTLVALPIAGDDAVAGAIVLSSGGPRPIAPEELLLWRAMANQVGVAVGSARLFSRLQNALRARSEFINTMSHELRSPLHVIIGYVDMVAEGTDPAFVAERIRASALELLQLLENTLSAASLGAGKLRLQPSEFSLAQLVTELRESVGALPEAAKGVPVRWDVSGDLSVVRLDRLKVKEIVHNLVSNALKFTERGEVVVRIGSADQQLRIEVEDTGSGIPREAQTRIFEMFERVDSADAPRAPGVGLGLYIVRSLVRMMRGAVTLASEPGRGSRFIVSLPIGGE